jgi:hypothetical protein
LPVLPAARTMEVAGAAMLVRTKSYSRAASSALWRPRELTAFHGTGTVNGQGNPNRRASKLIAVAMVADDDAINFAEATAGFAITGSTTGAENGQAITVTLVDSTNAVVNSYTAVVTDNALSVSDTTAQVGVDLISCTGTHITYATIDKMGAEYPAVQALGRFRDGSGPGCCHHRMPA